MFRLALLLYFSAASICPIFASTEDENIARVILERTISPPFKSSYSSIRSLVLKKSEQELFIEIEATEAFEIREPELDPIDLQIAASSLTNSGMVGAGNRYARLNAADSAILNIMHSLSDRPTTYEEALKDYNNRKIDYYQRMRANPERIIQDYQEFSWKRYLNNYYEQQVKQENNQEIWDPGFLIYLEVGKEFWTIEPVDRDHVEIKKPLQTRVQRVYRNREQLRLSLKLGQQELKSIRFALVNSEGKILDYLGGKKNFAYDGAYLLLEDPKALPRIPVQKS